MFSTVFLFIILANVITFGDCRKTTTRRPRITGKIVRLDDHYGKLISLTSGRPRLDHTAKSCWLRGGICMHVRDCKSLDIDSTVSGCNHGLRVCCIFNHLGPLVYNTLHRRDNLKQNDEKNHQLTMDAIDVLAEKNSQILNAQFDK